MSEKKSIRIFLNDNLFLRQVGLNNTFKTLLITETTSAHDLHAMMVTLMQKALPQGVKDIIEEQCKSYHIYVQVGSSERPLSATDRPWTLALLAEPKPKLTFRPVSEADGHVPPSSPSSGQGQGAASGGVEEEEGGSQAEGGHIKVFLGDNPVLRYLGLHNTQKTIFISSKDTTHDVERKIVGALSRGLSHEQHELIKEQTLFYRLFAAAEGKSPKLMAANQKPWNTQRRSSGKGPSRLLFQLHPHADDDAPKKSSDAVRRELQQQRQRLAAEQRATKQLEAHVAKLARPVEGFEALLGQLAATEAATNPHQHLLSCFQLLSEASGHQDSAFSQFGKAFARLSSFSHTVTERIPLPELLAELGAMLKKYQSPQLRELREQAAAAAAQCSDALDALEKKSSKSSAKQALLSSASLSFYGLNRQYVAMLQDILSIFARLEELLVDAMYKINDSCASLLQTVQASIAQMQASTIPRISNDRKQHMRRKQKQNAQELHSGYLLSSKSDAFSWNMKWYSLTSLKLVGRSDWQESSSTTESYPLFQESKTASLELLSPNAAITQPFCFKLISPSGTLFLRAMDEHSLQAWILAITSAIQAVAPSSISPEEEIKMLTEQCQVLRDRLLLNCERIDELAETEDH